MKNKSDYYAEIGLKAARRAADKVWEKAKKEGYLVPIWDGEKVVYMHPNDRPKENGDDSKTNE